MNAAVFVTGATGFTGSHLLRALLQRGAAPRCLYRDPRRLMDLPRDGVDWVRGDLADEEGLAAAMQGCGILLNTASLGFGHAPGLLRAAHTAGIRRAVFLSTTAIFTRINATSRTVRLAAEESIRSSGLDWTILRPTMIYGSPRDRNIWRLVRWLRRLPILPIFGSGRHQMQPIHVSDVAAAMLACLDHPATIGQAYNIAGKTPQTYNELVDIAAAALGRRVWKLHLPSSPFIAVLRGAERIGLRLPLKAEQIERLNEDKAFDYGDAARDFAFSPLSFSEGIRLELLNA